MKRKAGRPKLPKGKAKGKIVPIRVTKAEADLLAEVAKRSGQNVSEWIRGAVLAALEDERLHPKPYVKFTQNRGETVSDRTANLKPWPKGVSGNPGGRPKKKAITEELERLLDEEAPNGDGKTWAATIADSLLKQAAKGDVRTITELANRIEGKPVQAVAAELGGLEAVAEIIEEGRKRVARLSDEKRCDQARD